MLVYNIKRTINILGVPDLIAKLKAWKSPYKKNTLVFLRKDLYIALFKSNYFWDKPKYVKN